MSKPAPAVAAGRRAHWHAIASNLVLLDCWLLKLIPREGNQNLNALPGDLRTVVLKQTDQLVSDACRKEAGGAQAHDVHERLAKDIWNFLKPWRRSASSHDITHVSRVTNLTSENPDNAATQQAHL